MNPDLLALGFLEYVVFLLSTTCHEASHSLVAKLGGDTTAFEGGQVSLNPLPHIRREPFGMVVMPLIGIFTQTGLIGWASAPYDPAWSQKHPRRAAWMSLAGPGANFAISILAALAMRAGLAAGFFIPGELSTSHIVLASAGEGVAGGIATILSIFFSLNILLGCFNLIPFPPLDGYGVLGLFTTEGGALKLQAFAGRIRTFSIIGLLIAWRLLDSVYVPVLESGIRVLYFGYHLS
jgi:Zn-dependent protease